MKDLYKLFMTYAMMGMMIPMDMHKTVRKTKDKLTPEELAEIEKMRKVKELEIKKRKGLKEWNIDGITVIALNKKNAIRKVNKIKQLIKS